MVYSHTCDIVNCKWSTGQSVPRARVNHHRLGGTMHAVKGKRLNQHGHTKKRVDQTFDMWLQL